MRLEASTMILLYFFILICMASLGYGQTVDYSNRALTNVPNNISEETIILLLNNNDIASVSATFLMKLSKLKLLYLNNNKLTKLPAGVFTDLPRLTELYLQHNSLATLPEGLFDGRSLLRDLYLSDNELSFLPESIFAELTSLNILSLQTNRLSQLPLHIFKGLTTLTELYLTNNQLSALSPELFQGLPSLKMLFLQNNKLQDLPEGLFAGLIRLNVLSLHINQITTLSSQIFKGLTSLTELHLSSNWLASIPAGLLAGITNLQELSLRNNNLIVFCAEDIVGSVTEMSVINLRENPLDLCSCEIAALKQAENRGVSVIVDNPPFCWTNGDVLNYTICPNKHCSAPEKSYAMPVTGIIIGCSIFLAAIAGVAIFILWRYKKGRRDPDEDVRSDDSMRGLSVPVQESASDKLNQPESSRNPPAEENKCLAKLANNQFDGFILPETNLITDIHAATEDNTACCQEEMERETPLFYVGVQPPNAATQ